MSAESYIMNILGGGRKIKRFPIRSGRDVYNYRSLTGQNRSPVDDLLSYTLAGIRGADDLALNPDLTAEALLVDGSLVVYNDQLLDDVFVESADKFIQYLRVKHILDFAVDGDDMTVVTTKLRREYIRGDAGWFSQIVETGSDGSEKVTFEASHADAEIYVYPNDRGILYYAQSVFWNLEENKATQRKLMRGSAVLPLIDSDAGGDTWRLAYQTGENAIIAPYDKVNFPVASSTMAGLQQEADDARADWLDSLNVVEKDAPQRPSGSDREIRSRAMVNFVRTVREQLKEIYRDAFGVEIDFTERVITASAQEREQERVLIEALLLDGTISRDEAVYLKRKLV